MKLTKHLRTLALAVFGLGMMTAAAAAQTAPSGLLGVNCNAPPANHCPDTECLSTQITQPGNTVEPKTRRTFFLDCPAGYKAGDKINLVLALHGAGSYANWQRNYFPAMDVKDKYKLVIITPGSPTRAWTPDDDQYLANMVDLVVGTVGKANVQRFILAGHSQGGMTSNRVICSDYFKDKVDVRISLSGGRIGSTIPRRGFAQGAPVSQQPGDVDAGPQPWTTAAAVTGQAVGSCDYSFIYSAGEYENLPADTSPLADKYGCGARVRQADVVDTKPGYVWDSSRQDPGSDGWGHYPRSGKAQIYQFPSCKEGRVVADVVKLRKGHTEGYEPNVTDKIFELATSARGGKIANGAWTPPVVQPAVSTAPRLNAPAPAPPVR
jgi:pimeloyl-ACP methyl ester carboxylesterase